MSGYALIRVAFNDTVKPEDVHDEAERTVVAILENPVNANAIGNAEIVEEGSGPAGTSSG